MMRIWLAQIVIHVVVPIIMWEPDNLLPLRAAATVVVLEAFLEVASVAAIQDMQDLSVNSVPQGLVMVEVM